jgi:hypothetical protein
MDHKFTFAVAVGLVGCMGVNAFEGLSLGKAPSEVHLITSAPLVPVSSSSSTAAMGPMDYVHHNAIHDAVYNVSVPREGELTTTLA